MCEGDDKHFFATFNDDDIKRKAFQAESPNTARAGAPRPPVGVEQCPPRVIQCRIYRGAEIGPESRALLLVPAVASTASREASAWMRIFRIRGV